MDTRMNSKTFGQRCLFCPSFWLRNLKICRKVVGTFDLNNKCKQTEAIPNLSTV